MTSSLYTYALPKNTQAWHHAMELMFEQSLQKQDNAQPPIFAVILVIQRQVLGELPNQAIDIMVQKWVEAQKGWCVQIVTDDEQAKASAYQIHTHEQLTDVVICRYLLAPIDYQQISPTKQEAVAHIVDEQLTAYIKQQLILQSPDKAAIDDSSIHQYLDVHILSASQVLCQHKLVCFDMDSTLIEQEVIVELAKMGGVEQEVAEITERAMRGELAFSESFAQRVALLKGVNVGVVDEIINQRLSFSLGAVATIAALKAMGCYTVLISGGFLPFAKHVAATLGINEYYANALMSSGDELTGTIDLNVIDGKAKANIVARVAKERGIAMNEVICVGDGANDLPMMSVSNIGMAYHAKPIVQVKADVAINITGLEGVIYAMGHRFDKIN